MTPPLSRTERIAIAIAALALLAFVWLSAAQAAQTHFHIEAGNAITTLNEFSRQSEFQLLYDYGIVRDRTTGPIDGDLEVSEALTALLLNTGLDFVFVNENTVAVLDNAPRLGNGRSSRGIQGSGLVDENGYADCAPLRYLYSLEGYLQPSTRGMEICLKVAQL